MSPHNPYSSHPVAPPNGPYLEQQARSKLMAPGIALIVVGSIGLLLMSAYLAFTIYLIATGVTSMDPPVDIVNEAERMGFQAGQYGSMIVMALNALFQIVVILGGISMVKAKSHAVAFSGSVISVIPCCGSSLCLLGIPFGIWALVVLSDANVKRLLK